jgi:hypothetical protein
VGGGGSRRSRHAPGGISRRRESTRAPISQRSRRARVRTLSARVAGLDREASKVSQACGCGAQGMGRSVSNRVREEFQAEYEAKRKQLEQAHVAAKLAKERRRSSRCQGRGETRGGLHPGQPKSDLRIENAVPTGGLRGATGPRSKTISTISKRQHPRRSSGAGDARHLLFSRRASCCAPTPRRCRSARCVAGNRRSP